MSDVLTNKPLVADYTLPAGYLPSPTYQKRRDVLTLITAGISARTPRFPVNNRHGTCSGLKPGCAW